MHTITTAHTDSPSQGSKWEKRSAGMDPYPSPPFLFSPSPPFPLPVPSPSPSLSFPFPPFPPFPSLPLEVGPLNAARGSGADPQPKLNLVHFSLKIRHLVATILMIFVRVN